MKQKTVLGKGIASLIPDLGKKATSGDNASQNLIPVTQIKASKNQPRTIFYDTSLNELAQSIKSKGIIQPIIVRKENSHYEIVAGERRFRAAKLAGLTNIPAIITKYSELESLEASIIENVQREDINPIDAAKAYERLIKEFDLTQEMMSEKIGKDRTTIANLLRLLKLPNEVQKLIANEKISEGHGRSLLPLPTEKMQINLAHKIIREKLSVRVTEELVSTLLGLKEKIPIRTKTSIQASPSVQFLNDRLKKSLGTNVKLAPRKKGGKIIIDYYSNEDLDRLIEFICKK